MRGQESCSSSMTRASRSGRFAVATPQTTRTSSRCFLASSRIQGGARALDALEKVAVPDCACHDEVDVAFEQGLEFLEQSEIGVGSCAGIQLAELDEKIDITGFRIERLSGCRPEQLELLDTMTLAEPTDLGAISGNGLRNAHTEMISQAGGAE